MAEAAKNNFETTVNVVHASMDALACNLESMNKAQYQDSLMLQNMSDIARACVNALNEKLTIAIGDVTKNKDKAAEMQAAQAHVSQVQAQNNATQTQMEAQLNITKTQITNDGASQASSVGPVQAVIQFMTYLTNLLAKG